jgi:hypothetical protein
MEAMQASSLRRAKLRRRRHGGQHGGGGAGGFAQFGGLPGPHGKQRQDQHLVTKKPADTHIPIIIEPVNEL